MYCLPNDTSSAIGVNTRQVDNFSLRINKLVRLHKGKPTFYMQDKQGGSINEFGGFDFSPVKSKQDEAALQILKSAKEICNGGTKVFNGITGWRMVVGLGTESVYEVSMTLHHTYGFPFIPGQALKGLIRSYIISEKFGGLEHLAYSQSEAFCYLFGCPRFCKYQKTGEEYESFLEREQAGSIVFFDAIPTTIVKIEYDIMNPHYGEYYQDTTNVIPPADYFNPVPIPFLTVSNTRFQFILGQRKNKERIFHDPFLGEGTLLALAEKYFKEACLYFGFGAKSTAGYGAVELDSENTVGAGQRPKSPNENAPIEDQLIDKYSKLKLSVGLKIAAKIISFTDKLGTALLMHKDYPTAIQFQNKSALQPGQIVMMEIRDLPKGKNPLIKVASLIVS